LEQAQDRQQDDGSQQGNQHGRNGERIVDRSNLEDGAEEVTSQECAEDGHNMLIGRFERSCMISVAIQPITAATIK